MFHLRQSRRSRPLQWDPRISDQPEASCLLAGRNHPGKGDLVMLAKTDFDYGVAAAIIVSKMSISYPPTPEGITEMVHVWRDVCAKMMSEATATTATAMRR